MVQAVVGSSPIVHPLAQSLKLGLHGTMNVPVDMVGADEIDDAVSIGARGRIGPQSALEWRDRPLCGWPYGEGTMRMYGFGDSQPSG